MIVSFIIAGTLDSKQSLLPAASLILTLTSTNGCIVINTRCPYSIAPTQSWDDDLLAVSTH